MDSQRCFAEPRRCKFHGTITCSSIYHACGSPSGPCGDTEEIKNVFPTPKELQMIGLLVRAPKMLLIVPKAYFASEMGQAIFSNSLALKGLKGQVRGVLAHLLADELGIDEPEERIKELLKKK
jgi:hypothetical protein